jgi:hypothetical protein
MQEIVFPGFKFQKFSGDYAPTHVAFGHWYPPLISNDKLRLIFFFTFCAFFPSFISNFRANLDAQNAGNSISGFQISNIFWGLCPHTRGLRPLVSPSNK